MAKEGDSEFWTWWKFTELYGFSPLAPGSNHEKADGKDGGEEGREGRRRLEHGHFRPLVVDTGLSTCRPQL